MQTYAAPQPIDRYGNAIEADVPPALPAIQTNVSGALISSIIALDGRTTTVEIVTTGGAAGIKWFGSVIGSNPLPSVTTTNFDNAIPANWVRRLVVPISVMGINWSGSIVGGFGSQNGLYTQLAVIPLGAGALATSIFVSQYS